MNNNEYKSEINSEGYNERKKVITVVEKVIKRGYGYDNRQIVDENQPAMMFYGFLKEFGGEMGETSIIR